MDKFVNKLVKVITIYGEVIIGIVVQKPLLVLYLKTNNGIISINLRDIADIVVVSE